MITSRVNLVLNKGEDKVFFIGKHGWCHVLGPDFFGYTNAHMQVRPSVDSDEVVDELTVSNGRLKFEGSLLSVRFTAQATSRVKHRHCVYDLQVISPNGDVTRLLEGSIFYKEGVTR